MAPAARQSCSRPSAAHLGYGLDKCTSGFVDQFTDTRKGPTKASVTAQQHAVFRQNADIVVSMPPAWADNTKLNVTGILKKWKAFCETMGLGGDWKCELRKAQKGTAMDFLLHLCETYNIRSAGTCWQYFRQWKQLYSKTVGRRMDLNDSDEVLKFYKTYLIPQFWLEQPTLRAKGVTDSGDLLALLSFNYAYNQRIFPSEHQRLCVAGCYLILAYTGCRPAEVVDGEKPLPTNDVCWDELFGSRATLLLRAPPEEEAPPDAHSKEVSRLLELEVQSRGRPKALCYEDIQLMVVRHLDRGAFESRRYMTVLPPRNKVIYRLPWETSPSRTSSSTCAPCLRHCMAP